MTLIAKEPTTTDSDHWYNRDGLPVYTVKAKNGASRSTTLRDARTMNLVPSVTTILKLLNKPALVQWMNMQVLLAAMTLPRRPDEPEPAYIERVLTDSKAQGKAAADTGTAIHEAIQCFYEGTISDRFPQHVSACASAIALKFGEQGWIAERSFAHEIGFGGKCDLFVPGIVLDIKTQDFSDPKLVKIYDEQLMQLAAYRVGLGMPDARCANVFVSRTHPGVVEIREWDAAQLQKGWEMFACLLKFWQLKTDYS